jgi:hypothetical protein
MIQKTICQKNCSKNDSKTKQMQFTNDATIPNINWTLTKY